MWQKQGNIGVGEAICYFAGIGYTVSIPLNDSQYYDLIVEKDGKLQTVQVKTSSFEVGGTTRVTVKSSTKTPGGTKHYKYLDKRLDLIFVFDILNKKRYLIDSTEGLPKTQWKLDSKFEKFLI